MTGITFDDSLQIKVMIHCVVKFNRNLYHLFTNLSFGEMNRRKMLSQSKICQFDFLVTLKNTYYMFIVTERMVLTYRNNIY